MSSDISDIEVFALPNSIKEFNEQRNKFFSFHKVNLEVGRYYGGWLGYNKDYDEYYFKRVRDKIVDSSINELGLLFFSFEYVDICEEEKWKEYLLRLRAHRETWPDDDFIVNFVERFASKSIEDNLSVRVYNPKFRKFTAGWDADVHIEYSGTAKERWESRGKPSKHVPAFELSEFAYFVLDKEAPQVPKKTFNKGQIEAGRADNYEPPLFFSLKGLLAVKSLVGYNESEPLIREIEERRPIFYQNYWRFKSYAGGNFSLKALRTPEMVKSYWDELVAPCSTICTDAGYDLFRLHRLLPFNPVDRRSYSIPNNAKYPYWPLETFQESQFITHAGYDCSTLAPWPDFPPKESELSKEQALVIKEKILGVPVYCSYTTPAVLYNLLYIYACIEDLYFKEGVYYKRVNNSYLKWLGDEQWFRVNYFEVIHSLLETFDFALKGVDYLKLFSLQMNNVLELLKIKPLVVELDRTSNWRFESNSNDCVNYLRFSPDFLRNSSTNYISK